MAIPHEKPVYGISVQPQNDNIVATAGDDGRVLVFDIRESPFQGEEFHISLIKYCFNNIIVKWLLFILLQKHKL